MSGVLTALILLGGTILLVPSLYLLALTIGSVFDRRRGHPTDGFSSKFASLVPAHNEERLLPVLLRSIDVVDYPSDLYDVYVVADNCTDATAEVARQGGATTFERSDTTLIGKGHALSWLLEQIDASGYDAFLFLDADTRISTNFLAVMDERLRSGSEVVQSYYAASNPNESSVAALRYVALVLKHYVRPAGRRLLGLSCGLFGTGMVFTRPVIERFGWGTYGLTEDIEFFLKLTEHDVKVDFAPEATVFSDMPASYSEARVQNLRWERGRLAAAWQHGIPMLARGIREGKPLKIDAAVEQMIPPLSMTIAAALAFFALSLLTADAWVIAVTSATVIALLGHVVIGLASARAPLAVYRAFLYAPGFVVWKMWIFLQALAPGEMPWTRTER